MKNYYFLNRYLCLCILFVGLFFGCGGDEEPSISDDPDTATSPKPSLTSFSPSKGMVGTEVILTGVDFDTNSDNNEVEFNGTDADVISSTETEIKVLVPSGATDGKITLTTHEKTLTSETDFIVEPTPSTAPVISGFSPESADIGEEVTITGSNFGETVSENLVEINGVKAEVISASKTELKVTVPVGGTTGKIKVTVNDQIGLTEADFEVLQTPTITAISQDRGFVTTKITITGTNFSTELSDIEVRFGGEEGKSAVLFSSTETEIVLFVPDNVGSRNIYISVNGLSVESTETFEVIRPYRHWFFSSSPIEVGAELTINMFDLPSEDIYTVSFIQGDNEVFATVKSFDNNKLVVDIPDDLTTGNHAVRVQALNYVLTTSSINIFKNWKVAGTDGLDIAPGSTNGHHDIAVAEDGTIYYAFREEGNGDKLSVKKFNGTSWELVGSRGISAGGIGNFPTISVFDNVPYLIYNSWQGEADDQRGMKVRKFNGSTWEQVGTNLVTTDLNAREAILIRKKRAPISEFYDYYIGFIDPDNMNRGQLAVSKLGSDNTWTPVGTNPIISNFLNLYAFGFDGDGNLVAGGKSNQIATFAPSASDWTVTTMTNLTTVREGAMVFDSKGDLWYAYTDINSNVVLRKKTGNSWGQVVNANPPRNWLRINLTIEKDVLYLSGTENGSANVNVYSLEDDAWGIVGKEDFRSNVGQPRTVFSQGNPYIMFSAPRNVAVYTLEL
ncbi:IPT/TIG domain-containing protein [Reichenbachiella versicolor]|uniref:IPT/TIG domain-containing protein n=1 Tax=Reichenbachiella versicolor TaxID=1821036 RepID=UPI000D6E4C87|nr:IPT/TIG domain-containing protein [Reichenbachiella versicolor]